ncbi:hypothetical protein COV20_03070 [Candidatus Woesearchaeota archaeon CG10_big_fil_rev_8_21_14_0_10_45_16]|nr:MAG: hypothetical protein COV20_03070 [Candidatus Woesearchaeota archaeon CG10_big_fil_rev_8_21_14_0_10_45_16]
MDISKFVTLPDRVVMESAVQFKEIGYKFFGVRVTLVGAVITDYVDVLERQGTKALSAVRDAFADHLFEGSRKPFNYFTEHFIWHSPEDAAPLLAGFYPS